MDGMIVWEWNPGWYWWAGFPLYEGKKVRLTLSTWIPARSLAFFKFGTRCFCWVSIHLSLCWDRNVPNATRQLPNQPVQTNGVLNLAHKNYCNSYLFCSNMFQLIWQTWKKTTTELANTSGMQCVEGGTIIVLDNCFFEAPLKSQKSRCNTGWQHKHIQKRRIRGLSQAYLTFFDIPNNSKNMVLFRVWSRSWKKNRNISKQQCDTTKTLVRLARVPFLEQFCLRGGGFLLHRLPPLRTSGWEVRHVSTRCAVNGALVTWQTVGSVRFVSPGSECKLT